MSSSLQQLSCYEVGGSTKNLLLFSINFFSGVKYHNLDSSVSSYGFTYLKET